MFTTTSERQSETAVNGLKNYINHFSNLLNSKKELHQ